MDSKPLSFYRAFRTPSALSYLLKRMPEIDINDLGLGDEEIALPHDNISPLLPGQHPRSHGKPSHGFCCRHVFRKSKSPSKQASRSVQTGEDPKLPLKLPRSVSFHRLPQSHISGAKGNKHFDTGSRMTTRRIALDSESLVALQKRCPYKGTKAGKIFSGRNPLSEAKAAEEDCQEFQDEVTTKRGKQVRFVDQPEIIPCSSFAPDYEPSEESVHGYFSASVNLFKLLKR